jgi:hypothetical protein
MCGYLPGYRYHSCLTTPIVLWKRPAFAGLFHFRAATLFPISEIPPVIQKPSASNITHPNAIISYKYYLHANRIRHPFDDNITRFRHLYLDNIAVFEVLKIWRFVMEYTRMIPTGNIK